MMHYPLVTIVTVVRNDRKHIEKTIFSVLSQSYKNIEYIVIDGASTDGTMDVINQYAESIDVVVSEPDGGVYDAMNKGISLSHGEYVNFMNSGDFFHDKNVIEEMCLQGFSKVQRHTVFYGDVNTRYWNGVYREKPHEFFRTPFKFKGIGICHQSMFFPGDVIRKMPFNLKYPIAADYDMALKMYKNGVDFVYCNLIVADYSWGGGISSNPYGLINVYKENAKIARQTMHPAYWAKLGIEYYRLWKKLRYRKEGRTR